MGPSSASRASWWAYSSILEQILLLTLTCLCMGQYSHSSLGGQPCLIIRAFENKTWQAISSVRCMHMCDLCCLDGQLLERRAGAALLQLHLTYCHCGVQVSALCACMLGLSMGEAGVSIMHDVNHGSGLTDRSARYALGMGMDLVRTSASHRASSVLHDSQELQGSASPQ